MDKVLISVAPVSALDKEIDPDIISEDVINCYRAGAAMVHLHVRDSKGNLTTDMEVTNKIINKIKAETDMIIQVSSGGISNLTIEERCIPIKSSLVEATSLNVGSLNMGNKVYLNPIDDVKICIEEILKNNKLPEVEVFELGHIHVMQELRKEFNFTKPMLFSLVLGHDWALPAIPKTLMAMVNHMPSDVIWGITHANRKSMSIVAAALGLGASTVRIGFEDSKYLREGLVSQDNYSLVKKLVTLITSMDKSIMTAGEARNLLNID